MLQGHNIAALPLLWVPDLLKVLLPLLPRAVGSRMGCSVLGMSAVEGITHCWNAAAHAGKRSRVLFPAPRGYFCAHHLWSVPGRAVWRSNDMPCCWTLSPALFLPGGGQGGTEFLFFRTKVHVLSASVSSAELKCQELGNAQCSGQFS